MATIQDTDFKIEESATWTLDEFNEFIKIVDDYKILVLFHLTYYYGLRLGEVLALKPKNINFSKSQVFIVSQVVHDKYKHKAVESLPKTKQSVRKFYVDKFTLKLLKDIVDKDNVYLFGNKDRIPHRNHIREKFNKYIELSGVRKIRFHDLRSSCSTRLYNTISDVKAVGTLLGRSKETMTFHYIKAQKENDLKLIQELENSIKKDNEIYINLCTSKNNTNIKIKIRKLH